MKRRRRHGVTIRQQLAALALVVALPLLGAIAYTMYTARENAGDAAARASSQLADLTASSVQELIADSRAELAALAKRPLVRLLDPARCDPFLKEAHRFNFRSANFATVDLDGLVICSALPAPPGGLPNVGESEWFQRAHRTGQFTVGEPFLGPISHRRVAVIVLPMDDRGRRLGYVTLPIDLVRFQTLFERIAAPSRALVTVVTEAGVIVARSHEADRFAGTRVSPEILAHLHDPPSVGTGLDGVERIYARAPIAGTTWVVMAGIPTAVAYGASDRLLKTLLFIAAALLGLSFLAAIAVGRWIGGPIESLARRAREIAEGGGATAAPLHGSDEVMIAAQRLDEMVAALRASELQLGNALDAAGTGAWSIDLASGRTWRSLQHDRIFGHASLLPEWTIESSLAQVVPDDRELFQGEIARALETDRLSFECRIAWPDESEHWINVEGMVERGDDGEPLRITGTVDDVTDRVRADDERSQLTEALRQSQKMEAVGQLAGGIAHDFNNLLTVISGYCEFALVRLDGADPALRGDIEAIARAGDRAAQLTRQLLAFSRRQTLQPSVFDLNHAVSESETLLRRLLGEHIDIVTSFAPDGCSVNADRGQFEQILMNLAVNARDAMPDGGSLRIETALVSLDDDAARRFEAPAADYVLLRVSDTGDGMDADTQARAFEPFFTTKPPGEGTGLGLATVFGSVRQNGGYIALTSAPGAGATFEILVPQAATPLPDQLAAHVPVSLDGTERILLVEDDAVVRGLAHDMLSRKGYDVRTAIDGEEGFELAVAHPFDLLITDIVMPKLSGKELAARLRVERPDLAVVFMSGYAYDAAGGDLTASDAFIEKPFSMHDLCAIVRSTLDSAAVAGHQSS